MIRVTMPTIMCECVQANLCVCVAHCVHVSVCACVGVLHCLQLALSSCNICIHIYRIPNCSHNATFALYVTYTHTRIHTHTHRSAHVCVNVYKCSPVTLDLIYNMISLLSALHCAPYVAAIFKNLAYTISPCRPTAAATLPWTKPAYPSIMVSNRRSLCSAFMTIDHQFHLL